MRSRIFKIILVLVILGVGFVVAYRVFFLTFVRVPTGSMANIIIPGDHLVIKTWVGTVERGNLILFKSPQDSLFHISRVIGLPGETIEVRDRIVLINGKELPEQRVIAKLDSDRDDGVLREVSSEGAGPYRVSYYERDADGSRFPAPDIPFGSTPFKIPENQYFVMGDNRDNSYDSRFWGTVSRDAITGKPTMIYWSSRQDQSGNEIVRWERMFTKVR